LFRLARNDPKSAFAREAATWILLNTPGGLEAGPAAEIILSEHAASSNLVFLCQGLMRARFAGGIALLRGVLEKNPDDTVKAHACYVLATLLREEADTGGNATAAAEAALLFERVTTDFGEVMSDGSLLADRADRQLSNLQGLGIGKPAPEITGDDLEGREMKLSDYRGKVVALVFWGAWCGECMQMVPAEQALVARLAGRPFALIGVNSDTDTAKLNAVLASKKITWRSFRDIQPPNRIAKTWNVDSWPAIYILDRNGVIRFKNVRGQKLSEAVDTLLGE